METIIIDRTIGTLSDNFVIPKSKEPVITGKCLRFYSDNTGKPTDSEYYNEYYHNTTITTCDRFGKTFMDKLREHKPTTTCRLVHYMQR